MTSGVDIFEAGVRSLGHIPERAPGAPNHIVFPYTVTCGSFEGTEVRLGLHIPPDFPMTAPSGPHVFPILFADDGTGQVPRGGVHLNHDPTFAQHFGGEWQYWSRPYPNWSGGKNPVATYMAFIKRLWDAL